MVALVCRPHLAILGWLQVCASDTNKNRAPILLITKYTAFAERYIPTHLRSTPLDYWRAHNVVNAALCALVAGPFYTFVYFLMDYQIPAVTVLLCACLMVLSPLVLKLTGKQDVAQSTLVAAVYVCITVLTYYFGGLRSPVTLWLLCCPVVAMFLGGRKTAAAWFCIVMATLLAFFLIDTPGHYYPVTVEDHGPLLWFLADAGLMTIVVFYVYLYEFTKNRGYLHLEQALAQIGELAKRDELTGAYNRRHVLALIAEQRERMKRSSDHFCIALLDLDLFKRINDTYGHVAGDAVLRLFSNTISTQLRASDTFGRYGGEEFLVLMPATTNNDAIIVAERIRAAVAGLDLSDISPELHLTVSIGVSQYHSGQDMTDLINCADTALYTAKHGGRNQVCVSDIVQEGAHVA